MDLAINMAIITAEILFLINMALTKMDSLLDMIKFTTVKDINFHMINRYFMIVCLFILIKDINFQKMKSIIGIYFHNLHYFLHYFLNLTLNINHFCIFHLLFYLSNFARNYFIVRILFFLVQNFNNSIWKDYAYFYHFTRNYFDCFQFNLNLPII